MILNCASLVYVTYWPYMLGLAFSLFLIFFCQNQGFCSYKIVLIKNSIFRYVLTYYLFVSLLPLTSLGLPMFNHKLLVLRKII